MIICRRYKHVACFPLWLWHLIFSRLVSNQYVARLRRTRSILVVYDELDIVMIFRQAPAKHGYTDFGFTDPALALEQIKLSSKDYARDIRGADAADYRL